ncbi:hypothetical protein SNE510_30230 [Streptomyces sp. NE5-10]|nr:hypothetical protein SNE510_30230 [Streptomyces sp. NE5-10]
MGLSGCVVDPRQRRSRRSASATDATSVETPHRTDPAGLGPVLVRLTGQEASGGDHPDRAGRVRPGSAP